MKYRTGFVTNSSSVSFYVGKKEDRKLTIDDAFALLKECWNDYYDCAERLIQHILTSEKKEVRELIQVGNEREIWGEDIWQGNSLAWLTDTKIYVDFNDCYPEKKELLEALAKEFGIHPDDMEILTPYDLEKNQVVRKPWLTAGNWEEAEKLGIGRDDIQIFVLGDETYRAGILAYQRKEALSERDFETLDAYYEALDNIQGDTPPIDFDLQLGLGNMDFVEDEKQKACRECQVIVETWDSNIPIGVYNRMKARSLGAVYHGC